MKVNAGNGILDCKEMNKSIITDLESQAHALKSKFKEDGYLLVKDYLPRDQVLEIEEIIKQRIASNPNISLMSDQKWIKSTKQLWGLLEHPLLYDLIKAINKESTCLPFKWLRSVSKGLYTGLHSDIVYVGDISKDIITIWIPLKDIPADHGGLVVSPGSHRNYQWSGVRNDYANGLSGKINGTKSGWLCEDPVEISSRLLPDDEPLSIEHDENLELSHTNKRLRTKKQTKPKTQKACIRTTEARWATHNFKAGDIVLLDLNVFHMTAKNTSDIPRVSCDTRWIPLPSL